MPATISRIPPATWSPTSDEMPLRIRRLRLSDYDELMRLFEACGLDPRTRGRDSRSSIAHQLRVNRGSYLGALDGRRLIGAVLGNKHSRIDCNNCLAVRL